VSFSIRKLINADIFTGRLRRKRRKVEFFNLLGYIPIIGLFFKDKKKIVEETEVVVFITPSILPETLPKSE